MADVVWVSTIARTGSMWVYNVVRQLIRESDFNLEPVVVPQSDKEMVQLYANHMKSSSGTDFLALKVHIAMKPDLPNSKIISTHRDPRDIIASYLEFMNSDFEEAFSAVKPLISFMENYKIFDPNYLTMIPYHDIENNPAKVIGALARFMNLEVDDGTISSIAEKFSKKNVQKIITETDRKLNEKLSQKLEFDRNEMVRFSSTKYRSFNLDTGFQTKHISKRKTGDWVKVLTENQVDEINDFFSDWMDEYGYEY